MENNFFNNVNGECMCCHVYKIVKKIKIKIKSTWFLYKFLELILEIKCGFQIGQPTMLEFPLPLSTTSFVDCSKPLQLEEYKITNKKFYGSLYLGPQVP